MKLLYLLTAISFCAITSMAQDKPDLVTDRPDQTEAPVLVPKGGFQVETGFQIERDKNLLEKTKEYTLNTTLFKYGVNEYFELRLISEYLRTQVQDLSDLSSNTETGFAPLAIGMKLKIAEEKGFWPEAALIGHVHTKNGDPAYSTKYTSFAFRFTFAHTLSEKFSLSYNLGSEWNGDTPEATFLYTLSLAYKVSDKMGMFVEGYSFFPEDSKADNRVDAGVTYLITPVVQWDVSGGFGLSKNAPDSFISTGLSFRLFK